MLLINFICTAGVCSVAVAQRVELFAGLWRGGAVRPNPMLLLVVAVRESVAVLKEKKGVGVL